MTDPLTYPTPGMTRADGPSPPPGFGELYLRVRLGHGPDVFAAAAHTVLTWGMHRGAGFAVETDAARAWPGARVTVRAGPLSAPCLVVWAVEEPARTGFAYGTLPGHPECGEEAFLVERDADGSVRLTIRALSRPAAWYLRPAGPLGRQAQRLVARRYARAVRRAVAARGAV